MTPGIADALLAGGFAAHVVERLGPSQLAIPAENLKAVETALRREGRTLEPGIDRLSGRFSEREPVRSEAELHWEPDTSDNRPQGRAGFNASECPRIAGAGVGDPGIAGRLAGERRARDRGSDRRGPGCDRARYRPVHRVRRAEGITERQITPYEVEGAAVQAYCHSHGEERSFWLASIQEAVAVG